MNLFSFYSNFTKITSVEQRRKYKTEFANDYQEYKRLHSIIRGVSSRFAHLENELRNVEHDDRRHRVGIHHHDESPRQNLREKLITNVNSFRQQEIERKIYREYEENKRDRTYQEQQQR